MSIAVQNYGIVENAIDEYAYALADLKPKQLRTEATLYRQTADFFTANPKNWTQGAELESVDYDNKLGTDVDGYAIYGTLPVSKQKMCAIGALHHGGKAGFKPARKNGYFEDMMVSINDDVIGGVQGLRRAFYVTANILDAFADLPKALRTPDSLRTITEKTVAPLIRKAAWSKRARIQARKLVDA